MLLLSISCLLVSSCTTGRLEYITPDGEKKFACETEYTWEPSVDKYAVEYILSFCAKQAVEQGNTVKRSELLDLDLSVVSPPAGQKWTHELAKKEHDKGNISDKEYGYLIAYLDLGHDNK